MRLIQKIEMSLKKRDMTQVELESRAHLSVNRISKWKSGKGEPTARQALAIAEALRIDLRWLIDDEMVEMPAVKSELGPDEQRIIEVFRDSGLTRKEALTRWALPGLELVETRAKRRGEKSSE